MVLTMAFAVGAATAEATHAAALCDRQLDAPCRFPYIRNETRAARFARLELYRSRYVTPIVAARRIANGVVAPASRYNADIRANEWYINSDAIATGLRSEFGCLVYAFGVAEDDPFSNAFARRGCRVFAFDPTVSHPRDWRANVTFFPWGLRSAGPSAGNMDDEPAWSHPLYGRLTGELRTLPDIMAALGHDDGRLITAI